MKKRVSKKLDLKQLTEQFQKEMLLAWDEYLEEYKKFSAFEGKPLNDDDILKANEAFIKVQQKFHYLYSAINFIANYYSFSCNSFNEYSELIERLRRSGNLDDRSACDRKKSDLILH